MGMRPCGRVLWPLPGGYDIMAPGAKNGAVGLPTLYIIYVSRDNPPQVGRQKWGWDAECPVPIFVIKGTRRASGGPRTARSKGPAICRKAGRGVTAAAAGLSRRCGCQSCRLCRPRRR